MATIIKCGDEDLLSFKELTSFARKSLKNIIKKEGFTSYKVNVKDISTNGGNYLGTLQTVTVKEKSDKGDKELNLFIKNIVSIDESSGIFSPSEVYLREGFFYTELHKLFEKIQNKYNIPEEEKFNAVKGYGEQNSEVIILEDISKAGYKTYDRFDVISIKFAELAIEQLAKLHVMSIILKIEHPKYFDNHIKPLRVIFQFNAQFEAHLRRLVDKAKETLDGDVKTKLDNFFLKMSEKYKKYVDVPVAEAVCLVHGDFRANNILVKEIEGEAVNVIPVDYQLINYGCPVTDLIYFIFTATDQEFRRKHLENLKELYYSTFETFLSKFGVEAEAVYSRKKFEDEYRESLDYGLICFLILMPFLFAKLDDVPDLEHGLEGVSFNMDDCYKDRLHGVIDDFIQWGYL